MTKPKRPASPEEQQRVLAELRREAAERQRGYRERALALFPHVCASCGRAFEGARLKELTVHHRDHNHHNNPPDGSNWELLCVYCHDHEHEKDKMAGYGDGTDRDKPTTGKPIFQPFAGLDSLINSDEKSK